MSEKIEVINIKDKLSLFDEFWVPKVIGELNDVYIKVVKFLGEYCWHSHEKEDELFLVIKGNMVIELRERKFELGEGEFIIIPRGAEHKPIAEKEAHVVLIEAKTVINTGNVREERTLFDLEKI
jgi:mannose-6-phosphate isomerase-like protein (cupin superfamily)